VIATSSPSAGATVDHVAAAMRTGKKWVGVGGGGWWGWGGRVV
jgi:hypothetical protein